MPEPQLVGILNVTPDSFSDGGQYNTLNAALAQAEQLIADGAAVIDIGAESTRPNAAPVSATEEWQRLEPLLPELIEIAHAAQVKVSLDTRHPETAARALPLGIDWLNDVTGFDSPAMREVVAPYDANVVVMHNLGVPVDPSHTLPEHCDPVAELRQWAERISTELEASGITRERIILDPGIGFGKTAEQSLTLLRHANDLRLPGTRLLIGHSRKSFLSRITHAPAAERDPETLAVSLFLAQQGRTDYLRIHNVAMHRRAFNLTALLT